MTPKNSVRIAHLTKNRVRFVCERIGLECDESRLEARISEFRYAKSVRVNKKAKSVIIGFESNFDEIKEFIENLPIENFNKRKVSPNKSKIYKAATALAVTPFITDNGAKALSSLIAAAPLLKEGASEALKGGITSKVLEATAVGVSLARRDFLAANSTNLMLTIGEYMEESAVHRSDDLIKELARPNIEEVWIEVNNHGKKSLKKIATADVKVGDIVVVGAGESIGIDGYIVEGTASVNQVSMTGEAEPVKKERGDRVMSGTVVEDGRIKIWAESIASESATARIKSYIQSSLNEKSAVGLKATKLADKLVPVTLSLAGVSYLLSRDMTRVASVLQADYSCALKLATPVAFKSSISKAGRNGVLIKGAKAIEALASADTFVFDKTGTLTHGSLSVVKVHSFKKEFTEAQLLNLTASAEEHYFHPVAEAIVKAAREIGFHHIHHDEVEFIVAHGVKTYVGGKEVVIGSRHFLEDDEQISFSKHEKIIKNEVDSGLTLLYVGYDKELLGVIAMRDTMRENAAQTLARLRKLGVKELIMLTGDVRSKAGQVANELGIDRVYANCLPTDKAGIIEQLKAEGKKVAFVGDGINDAPSLTKAHVGISMQKGADIAKATADISLLKDDIGSVAVAKDAANKTIKLINANFNATVGINSLILAGATFGFFNPIATAVLHNGTTIGLLANSMKGVKLSAK
ncbi:heavy metal translocating P-type ATPase [Campylobacter rectus RM3267]|uniref:P-type Zn(2+) transporter n=2 Tax=Campylobacter rectus TaxID=203 RepID=A0A6G5QME7_CAMRE|nr:heavy metal translocating P-type ATPase [Campylobacter rectus]EEF13068.1 heavy metal translocating P-type ATPase [Campylobacter rectus RM3267]QCD46764.1 heavy metal translocating P-type ATPase [Campylobacter rectus]UEB47470.1 heavy metal translocating P-type ATPase [Campylobacter rectus]